MRALPALLALAACNAHPGYPEGGVEYRPVLDDGPSTGERGNIIISEILWSGSVRNVDGTFVWDPDDVFIEIRNQGSLPVEVEDWRIELEGPRMHTIRLPDVGRIESGEQVFFAKKSTGCFPNADAFIPEIQFPPVGDPIELTLRDADEHLIEPVGSPYAAPPFAGGFDLVVSRSMERTHLMFSDSGMSPHMWHHYTNNRPVDVTDNDRMDPSCTARTLASPGRPNSADYSGSTASGGFE